MTGVHKTCYSGGSEISIQIGIMGLYFIRVSTTRMRYLREKYGHMIADRALAKTQ